MLTMISVSTIGMVQPTHANVDYNKHDHVRTYKSNPPRPRSSHQSLLTEFVLPVQAGLLLRRRPVH